MTKRKSEHIDSGGEALEKIFSDLYVGRCGFGGKPETRGLLSSSSPSKTAAVFYFFCVSWKGSDSVNMQANYFSSQGLQLGERNVL